MEPTVFDWRDISHEEYREYVFPGGEVVRVSGTRQHITKSGAHKIDGVDGLGHYIPAGWVHLRWKEKPGYERFPF